MALDVGASADVDMYFADQGVSATYRHGGTHTVDAASLTETNTPTDDSITAVKRAVTKREIESSGGKLVEGDMHWDVRAADLSSAPASDDQVVYGVETWHVIDWTLDEWGIVYDVLARKW